MLRARLRGSATKLTLLAVLLPMLANYSIANLQNSAPPNWVIDIFLDLSAPYETLLSTLESMFYADEPPLNGRNRRFIANDIVYMSRRWYEESVRGGGLAFGGEENAVAVAEALRVVMGAGVLDQEMMEEARVMSARVEQVLR